MRNCAGGRQRAAVLFPCWDRSAPRPRRGITVVVVSEVLSPLAAADLVGVDEPTIRRWVKSGQLAADKRGGRFRIARSALEPFLEPARQLSGDADGQSARFFAQKRRKTRLDVNSTGPRAISPAFFPYFATARMAGAARYAVARSGSFRAVSAASARQSVGRGGGVWGAGIRTPPRQLLRPGGQRDAPAERVAPPPVCTAMTICPGRPLAGCRGNRSYPW